MEAGGPDDLVDGEEREPRTWVRPVLMAGVGVLAVVLVLWRIGDPGDLWRTIRAADWAWVAVALAAVVLVAAVALVRAVAAALAATDGAVAAALAAETLDSLFVERGLKRVLHRAPPAATFARAAGLRQRPRRLRGVTGL